MSQTETFLKRWSRRKAQSAERPEVSAPGPAPGDGEAKPGASEATPAPRPEASEPGQAALDPASLPPIESIVAETDIRPFLQSGAPEALTRAALRRAWATDPAIRDFIGIAENQWDFNDPTAMPGFGPLSAADAAALAAQMLSGASDRLARIAETSVSAAPVEAKAVDQFPTPPSPPAQSPAGAGTASLAKEQTERTPAGSDGGFPEQSAALRNPRTHGGALPR
jgi:Protein of unknown function (DUF3306)